MKVAALVTVVGDATYYQAGGLSVASVLEHSQLPVFVGCDDPEKLSLSYPGRLTVTRLSLPHPEIRASGFLAKFHTVLKSPLPDDIDVCVLVDADCVLATTLSADDILAALGDFDFAMVEQKTVTGSGIGRKDFLDHFSRVALPVIDKSLSPPALDVFRYWNSGIVIARTQPLRELASMALGVFDSDPHGFSPGGDLVTDQDFFQYWGTLRHPGSIATLQPRWNNCAHWDESFPMPDAIFLHWSNFCLGPNLDTLQGMKILTSQRSRRTACVVSYNSSQHLRQAITSAKEAGFQRVLVWDNGSSDGSATLAEGCGAEVIRGEQNIGFGAAQNRLARLAQSQTVCFLNPDATVSEATIAVAEKLLADDAVIAVSPQFVDEEHGSTPGVFPGYTRLKLIYECWVPEGQHEKASRLSRFVFGRVSRRWSWPLGACLFVRRNEFLTLGGFSEDFFLYMEDVDFGYRASTAGFEVKSTETTEHHRMGTGSDIPNPARIRLIVSARIQFARKHFGWLTVWLCSLSPWARGSA